VRVWRISKERYATGALTGKGGIVASGRWHYRGTRIVYTSNSLSLAALEYLVHVDPDIAPDDMVSMEIDVPDDVPIAELDPLELPRRWDSTLPSRSTQSIGTQWIDMGETAVLRVPSVVIQPEYNYLINPSHSDFDRISIAGIKPFSFDLRLHR